MRFDGAVLKLVVGAGGAPPAATSGLAISANGRVFVGSGSAYTAGPRMNIEGGTEAALSLSSSNVSQSPGTLDVSNFELSNGVAVHGYGHIGVLGEGAGVGNMGVYSYGIMGASALGTGGNTALCWNSSGQISSCSSSRRYKDDLQPFADGLNVIDRLQPIAFRWKADDMRDVGFGAEEVETIDPLFVTYNDTGAVEGVKYDRLSVLFVNAFKQQQAQIQAQLEQIDGQARRIELLQAQFERQQQQLDAMRESSCREGARGACNE